MATTHFPLSTGASLVMVEKWFFSPSNDSTGALFIFSFGSTQWRLDLDIYRIEKPGPRCGFELDTDQPHTRTGLDTSWGSSPPFLIVFLSFLGDFIICNVLIRNSIIYHTLFGSI
jgi:hypothetical protein